MSPRHVPVLLDEVAALLDPRSGEDFIDCTLGYAGHTRRLLEGTAPNGKLLCIDADSKAIDSARASLRTFAGRVILVHSYFDSLGPLAVEHEFGQVSGILFDLGVSTPQLEDAARGFAFAADGPLDMRVGQAGRTAADIISDAGQQELTRIFREYGEERYAARIARRIVAVRQHSPLTTTAQLADLVARAIPGPRGKIHPATRVFQALRIAVNDELGRLERSLAAAVPLLRTGGKLAVISFHSLEDRIVKRFMRDEARGCICPPDAPACICGREPRLRIITPKPVTPSTAEIASNPRSRSAKLRCAQAL